MTAAKRPLQSKPYLAATLTTALVTALAYLLPMEHAATGVGLAFLGATYFLTLREADSEAPRRYGLSLGGLFDAEPLSLRRLVRDGARALGAAFLLAGVVLPIFWAGFVFWWKPEQAFAPPPSLDLIDGVLGQLLVIALPEEAFYRGYLQTALDERHEPRWRIVGARLGSGVLISSAFFAAGHFATEVHPNRLAVFFPSLLFGYLRTRTGGVGAPACFHALCNLFASFLSRGYGLSG